MIKVRTGGVTDRWTEGVGEMKMERVEQRTALKRPSSDVT